MTSQNLLLNSQANNSHILTLMTNRLKIINKSKNLNSKIINNSSHLLLTNKYNNSSVFNNILTQRRKIK